MSMRKLEEDNPEVIQNYILDERRIKFCSLIRIARALADGHVDKQLRRFSDLTRAAQSFVVVNNDVLAAPW